MESLIVKYYPIVLAMGGGLVLFGWLKKTISGNVDRINKIEASRPIPESVCTKNHDRLSDSIYKLSDRLTDMHTELQREVLQNKAEVMAQFQVIARAIGRLEGMLETNGKRTIDKIDGLMAEEKKRNQ